MHKLENIFIGSKAGFDWLSLWWRREDVRALWGCMFEHWWVGNLFIYQARESSLVPAGFLTAQFLQKM